MSRPLLYRSLQATARVAWRLFGGRIELIGAENVPREGPVLIISNHQSVLDPIMTQGFLPRTVHAMAKSTQFNVPVIGWLMRHICVFPVRRFQVDAQAVRTSLRLLRRGEAVAIYIEGERSWNASLQEPRRGTVRLALRSGVPIVLCAVSGSYDVWPRWARRPKPGTIRIRFLEAIRLGELRGQANRDAVEATAAEFMNRLESALRS